VDPRPIRCLGLLSARSMLSLSAGDRGRGAAQRILERNAVDGAKTGAGVPPRPRLVAGRSAARIAYPIVDVTIDLRIGCRIELRIEVADRFAKARVDQGDETRVKRSGRAGSNHRAYVFAVLEQRVAASAVGIAGDIGNRARLVPVIGRTRNFG